MKTLNEYQAVYPGFEETPKAVIAAVALSLAMRLSEDDLAAARALVADEWGALYAAGIVPQRPRQVRPT